MKVWLSVALTLLLGVPASAQSTLDHITRAQAELEAAKAQLVPPGPGYNSLSDLTVKPKPLPLLLGGAGFAFTDPTFGSPMWRVSDRTTSGGSSIRVPSSQHTTAWNTTGTMFFGVNEGGGTIIFNWDGTNVTRSNKTVVSQLEPQFSFVDSNVIFGVVQHKIRKTDLSTNVTTDALDLDKAYPSLPLNNTYVGGILLADGDKWAVHFGGAGIDQHVFIHHSTAGLLDVRSRNWKVHAISLERSGRFVFVYPAVDPNTGQLPPGVAQVWIWDTQTGALTPQTVRPAGHGSMGYGRWINQDCCTSTTWDAVQYQLRSLDTPTQTRDLFPTVLTPQHVYVADHTNWRADRAGANVPIVTCNYRFGAGLSLIDYPPRALDEECFAIATDGTGKVWRFAHHQSVNPADFWNQPIINVSPDGRYAIFTSNWGNPTGKQDIFLLRLR